MSTLLLTPSNMNNEPETEDRRHQDRRRRDPHNDETPVSHRMTRSPRTGAKTPRAQIATMSRSARIVGS
jgi:hypothetical protein